MQDASNSGQTPQAVNVSKRDWAKLNSVSERTVDNLVAQGMPVIRISSRKLLFPVADCTAWIRERFLVSRKRPSNLRRPRPVAVLNPESGKGDQ